VPESPYFFSALDGGKVRSFNYRIGIFDRRLAVVFAHMRFVGEAGQLESDAGFFGGVPAHLIHYVGASYRTVEQILDGGGNGQRGPVVQTQ